MTFPAHSFVISRSVARVHSPAPIESIYRDATLYLQHASSGEVVLFEAFETLVLSVGHEADRALGEALEKWNGEVHWVGGRLAPRTVEQAALECLEADTTL